MIYYFDKILFRSSLIAIRFNEIHFLLYILTVYSLVPNRCPPPLINFFIFSTQEIFILTPLAINF